MHIGGDYTIYCGHAPRGACELKFYNSTYYHNKNNLCYVVRGFQKRKKLLLDGMDEEDIIQWICENEEYRCIADLCMGRGLVAVNAAKNGKMFVGTEMNHKRLSVALERLASFENKYKISDNMEDI